MATATTYSNAFKVQHLGQPKVGDHSYLLAESKALLVRLKHIQPFSMTIPMVAVANLPLQAQQAIDELIKKGKIELKQKIEQFINLLRQTPDLSAEQSQKAFALLKLQFNALLDKFDIFADVVSQRSEHFNGVWLAGLDALAKDALTIQGNYFEMPPMVCYLDRGHGAAIRRARTRLPGGKSNPVAVIKVPRERMVSNGIASSLIHEVGHQGAALLNLIVPLKLELKKKVADDPSRAQSWRLFERWISEILSDFWSVATIGIGSTTGLMGVVSLPRYFMFRMNLDDPHPFPWIRVKISLAFGKAIYPDDQWGKFEQMWNRFYPSGKQPQEQQAVLQQLENTIPEFVRLIIGYKALMLHGQPLGSIFPISGRQPPVLRKIFQQWKQKPAAMKKARPALVFAVLGQARADQRLSPEQENAWLREILVYWAKKSEFVNN